MRMLGLILVILGALALGYGGFTYVTREKVVDAGPVQVTADKQNTVWIPPIVGGSRRRRGPRPHGRRWRRKERAERRSELRETPVAVRGGRRHSSSCTLPFRSCTGRSCR